MYKNKFGKVGIKPDFIPFYRHTLDQKNLNFWKFRDVT